ncbi:PD-(D/E)XK nuclease-like domain-containing protein [Enterobacter hormaechei]|nr:PD-(D/E)XK nuclease-like domain-containing protein [Enterobacter hormaechei]MCE1488263.1 PD-(D/E)XK nuclease-like domain-containing protein [Enterobacter hormaechei]MCE1555773.1 PD-(D/E)XK nuclease-like domain-containing protein [Enterobacter hormaechei]
MTNTNPVFLVRRAKKQSGQPDAVLWCSEDFETANATLDYLLLKSGRKFKDYYKAVATNFPVVNELPPEGEISFTFCDYYQLDKGKMNWEQIPGVSLPEHPATQKAEMAEATVVNGVDTSTGEIVDEQAFNEADAVPPINSDLKIDEGDDENTRYPIVQMSFRKQLLSQLTSDELRYHLTQAEYQEISTLEMDTDNGYVQNLLLAAASVEKIQTLDMPFLWKYTRAVRDVFDMEKRHELSLILKFTQVWAETSHLDRGILTKEWAKGNRISAVQRTDSGTNADGGYKTDRGEGAHHTLDSLDLEIACALLPMDFNPHEIPGSVLRRAKEIVAKKEEPWKSWSNILRNQPGVLAVNRTAIFNLVRIAPENIHKTPAAHLEFVNRTMTTNFNSTTELMPLPSAAPVISREDVDKQLAAERGEFVEGISDPTDTKWKTTHRMATTTHEENLQRIREEGARRRAEEVKEQPEITSMGNGMFSIEGLLNQSASNEVEKKEVETTSNVQVQENNSNVEPTCDALSPGKVVLHPGESSADTGEEPATVEPSAAEILATSAPSLASQDRYDATQIPDSVDQNEPESAQNEPEVPQEEPAVEYPAYFEPGRYEGLPNNVYHAANGLSSTQVKDARVSLMYFNARHVAKTISQQDNPAFIFGRATHSLVLEPEKFADDYVLPEKMPEGVVSTTGEMVALIKEYNATLPALMTPDELKAWIEEYNGNLTPPLSVSAGADEIANSYMSLPEEFQRIPAETKPTATAMKACIKEYNASLEPILKTSGTRDQLLDQIATVAPQFAEQERAKFIPYNVSGAKEQLTEIVRTIRPDVVFADDWYKQQEEANAGKETISLEMYEQIKNINDALQANKDASRLLNHPARQSEVSYFGFDEETGLEVRVRPDIEIRLPYESICADLKTVSLGYVRQDKLKDRLHREIIDRDYHLSAAMYCDIAGLDKFTWIFVNKDPGYHWVAVVDASPMLLELGRKEYRRALRQIEEAMETGYWPAPITEAYTDDLNDYDTRRLEALDAE